MSPKQTRLIEDKLARIRAARSELDWITTHQARLAERLVLAINKDDCEAVGVFMAEVLDTVSRKDQLDAVVHHRLQQARRILDRIKRRSTEAPE